MSGILKAIFSAIVQNIERMKGCGRDCREKGQHIFFLISNFKGYNQLQDHLRHNQGHSENPLWKAKWNFKDNPGF